MNEPESSLLGEWVNAPDGASGVAEYGQVSMDFKPDGRLIYSIHHAGRDEIMLLTYRIEGDAIITDQQSMPRTERSQFRIQDGKLYLTYEDTTSVFVRKA